MTPDELDQIEEKYTPPNWPPGVKADIAALVGVVRSAWARNVELRAQLAKADARYLHEVKAAVTLKTERDAARQLIMRLMCLDFPQDGRIDSQRQWAEVDLPAVAPEEAAELHAAMGPNWLD